MPIKTASSSGGALTELIPNPDATGYMGYGSISPDGTKIAYLYYPTDGTSQLRIAALDGSSDVIIAQTSPSAPNPDAWANVAWGQSYIAVNCNGIDNTEPLGYGGATGRTVGIRFFDESGDSPPAGILGEVDETWTNVYPSGLDLAYNYSYPSGSNYDNMSWSPQGRYLYASAFRRMDTSNNSAACIVRIDTHDTIGHDLEIIALPPAPGPVNGQVNYTWPVLSPDGTKLVVTKKMNPWGGGSYTYGLVLMNEDGSGITDLVNDVAWPIWSPDGTKLCGYNTGAAFGWYDPVIYDIASDTVTLVTADSSTYGNAGWNPAPTRPAETARPVPHPTPLTNKVWFFSDSDILIHTMDPDGTNDTLRDSQVAPNHVWLGGTSPSNWWAIRPQGDYAYFIDTDHSTSFALYKSWNNSTHYRKIAEVPGTYAFRNFNPSWDGTKVLADLTNPSGGIAYLWMDPNGVAVGGTELVTPSNLTTGWEFLYSQGAMQCLSPDNETALIWNSSNSHIGTFNCATGTYQDFGALGWIAPAWSSQNKIAYLDGTNVNVIDGTTHAVEHTFTLSPAGSLNYICMWNPSGTELLLDDNAGTIKRYQPNGTYLNTLAIYPSWPIGWS